MTATTAVPTRKTHGPQFWLRRSGNLKSDPAAGARIAAGTLRDRLYALLSGARSGPFLALLAAEHDLGADAAELVACEVMHAVFAADYQTDPRAAEAIRDRYFEHPNELLG